MGKNEVEKPFYINHNPLHSSLLRSVHTRETKKVQVITLDGITKKLKLMRINWIKIDVEGGEMDVLDGGEKTLSALIEKIIIETNSDRVLKFLSERNFKIHRLENIYFLGSRAL